MSWKAEIVYDADGTKVTTLSGHRISSQIFKGDPPSRALITVFDADGREIESLHVSACWSIRKTRETS